MSFDRIVGAIVKEAMGRGGLRQILLAALLDEKKQVEFSLRMEQQRRQRKQK